MPEGTTTTATAQPDAAAVAQAGRQRVLGAIDAAKLRAFLSTHAVWRWTLVVLALTLVVAALALTWFVWFRVAPAYWDWAFSRFSFASVVGFFTIAPLVLVPLYAVGGAGYATVWMLGLTVDAEADRLKGQLEDSRGKQADLEQEMKSNDRSGLVSLVQYSRLKLDAYEDIGLANAKASFRHAVRAMWAGFLVVMFGVLIQVVDLQPYGLQAPDSGISALVVLAGVVIEVVAALFLWVFRYSERQTRWYYARQAYIHNVLVCHRIAETMQQPDAMKQMIVERILSQSWAEEMTALPSAANLLGWRRGGAPPAPGG